MRLSVPTNLRFWSKAIRKPHQKVEKTRMFPIENAAADSDNNDDRSVNWKFVMGNFSTKRMSESDEDGPNGVTGMRLLHEEVLGMD